MNNYKLVGIVLISMIFCTIYYFSITKSHESTENSEINVKNFEEDADIDNGTFVQGDIAPVEGTKKYIVHVCGEVNSPGVYLLEEGSRISDAIEAAGGFTLNADTDYHNLAKRLEDEQQIYVPDNSEESKINIKTQSVKERDEEGRININAASKSVLMELKGIGDIKAERIIQYRERNGNFKNTEEIKKVEGITASIYNGIKDYITVK